ncbi:hypothetical protein L3081_02630 [Colwellia sp. MSW7]|uniref:DnrO protein n=1 Tax=Colwellia maritima TaxID=2912588 RepID=A0ABS9WWZ4_9GAMM|nr:hypothetical protein [Colwellia maritima]MCI2282494.1 hypothetical protein [Colwellia maritima]
MKKSLLIFTLVLILSTLIHHKVIAAEHEHHHEVNEAKLSLNDGHKWPIDKSLHIGMNKIKIEIANNLSDIHHDQFSAEQYTVLATRLEAHLNFLFANCQLPPSADAQLHTLLAKVMQGVDNIKHSTNKKQGAVQIIQALRAYPVYFADTNWQSIQH